MNQDSFYDQRLLSTTNYSPSPFTQTSLNGYSNSSPQPMNVITFAAPTNVSPMIATNTIQSNVSTQTLKMNEYGFFHHTPNDDNFYHVTCRIILNGSVPSDDYDYDYGFFYQCL